MIPAKTSIPLMEHFYSVQGEGFYQGSAAWFIRLAGCDVGCHWCDVKESWDATEHPVVEIKELVEEVSKDASDIAIITGGEPAMYDLNPLTSSLKANGMRTHIETSAAHELSGEWDWVCVSPKKFKAPLDSVLARADELKVVVYNKSDFQFAQRFLPKLKKGCKLYLQPEWSVREKIEPMLVDFVKDHPEWRICLQVHKYLDIR